MMARKRIRATSLFSVLSMGVFLGGCLFSKEEKTAGAQDFPNTLEPVAALVQGVMPLQGEWSRFGAPYDDLAHTTFPTPRLDSLPLAKSGAGAGACDTAYFGSVVTRTWDFSDTARGFATQIRFIENLSWWERDTIVFLYDSAFKDGISGNEKRLSLRGLFWIKDDLIGAPIFGKAKFISQGDGDGDGTLDLKRTVTVYPVKDGTAARWITVEKPGADGCLDDWGDNAYLSLAVLTSRETDSLVRREAADTLVYEAFKDASLKGLTLANLLADPYLLDYTRIEMGDSADAGVARSEMKALLSIHPLDSSRTLPQRFSLRQIMRNGTNKAVSLSGGGPDSAALPGETVRVRIDTTSPAPDTVVSFSMTFMVSLSDSPRIMQRNAILTFSVDCELRGSSIAQASLLFEPALPVLFGGPSKEGKLTASVQRIPSGSASLVGRYSGSRVEATYVEQPSGVSHEVVLDGGRVVSTRENGP